MPRTRKAPTGPVVLHFPAGASVPPWCATLAGAGRTAALRFAVAVRVTRAAADVPGQPLVTVEPADDETDLRAENRPLLSVAHAPAGADVRIVGPRTVMHLSGAAVRQRHADRLARLANGAALTSTPETPR